jgi:hypothetical protein
MNLLYTKNGIVLGWHDSQLASVPSTAYGTGVRIIPYAGAISDLNRVGTIDTTLPPGQDPRQYAEPDPTPEILKAFSGQVRFDTVTAGITWNSIPVKTDRVSQSLINGLAVHASTMTPTDMIDFTQDGIAYQFPASDAADLNNQVNAFVQNCRTTEAQCLADLGSASPTIATYADVEARFSGLKAKTLAAKQGT